MIFNKLVTTNGRMNRQNYAIRFVGAFGIALVLEWISGTIKETMKSDPQSFITIYSLPLAIVYLIIVIAIFLYSLSFTIRRWHDLNKSGWWTLLCVIPLLGLLFQIYLLFPKGTKGNNTYGAPQK